MVDRNSNIRGNQIKDGTITYDELDASGKDALDKRHSINTDTAFVKNEGSVNPINLLSNGDFENWSAGASAAPDGWTLTGAGASVAREGTTKKHGSYSAKLTRAGTNCYLINTNVLTDAYVTGRAYILSCWVWCDTANSARIAIGDADNTYYSAYHSGGSTWELLTASHATMNGHIEVLYALNTIDTSAYFDGAMCVEGESAFAFADKPASEGVWADYSAVSTIVGWSSFTTKTIYTKRIGKTVFVSYVLAGVSDNVTTTFTVPYNIATGMNLYFGGLAVDNAGTPVASWSATAAGSNTIVFYKNMASESFTASGTKVIQGQFFYVSA